MRFAASNVPKSILSREQELIQKIEECQMKPIRNNRDKRTQKRQIASFQRSLDAIAGQMSNRLNGGILQD